jgi:hypothetical protein
MAEMRASPVVSPYYKRIAEVLRELHGPMGQIIPGSDINPFKALMPQASTFENLAYGNSPFSDYPSVTNRRLPVVKTGREQELTDIADIALMASGVPASVRGVKRAADAAGDVMVQFLTGNPKATAMGVLDEAGRMAPLSRIFVPAKDEQALAMAQAMEARGVRPAEIWEKTGMGRLPAGRDWVQETSDQAAINLAALPKKEGSEWEKAWKAARDEELRRSGYDPENISGISPGAYGLAEDAASRAVGALPLVPLRDVYRNPNLEEVMPDLVNRLRIGPEDTQGIGGTFVNQRDYLTVTPPFQASFGVPERTERDVASTIVHELQHGVQYDAGHGLGGNPGFARDQLERAAARDPAFAPEKAKAHANWKTAMRDLGIASKGQYLNKLKELSLRSGLKPRMVTGMSDWYAYGNEYRSMAGKMPSKPGFARDEWLRGAAQHILDRNLQKEPWAEGIMEEFDPRTARNTMARANRALDKNRKVAQEFEQAMAKYKGLRALGEEPRGDVKLYNRLEGEALARLAQTRMDLMPAERRANYPFHQQYERTLYGTSTNPIYETKKFNEFGLDVDPMELFVYRETR